jgi:dihydrodipicolinate synthase/N-acetylneuraminate lyase
MLAAPLRGIITPLVTPLVRGALDIGGLERMVEHVITGGMNGIFILGTTGEGPSLSHAIREEMILQSCRIVGGRVPLLVSVSDTSLVESERMAEIAAKAGADAAVIAPPYYFQYSQSDLIRYVELAAFRFALPIFLYNIPQLTKVAFEVETVCHAARVPGILGLKDSSSDLKYLSWVIQAVKEHPGFSVLTGPEEILYPAIRAGSHGGVCGGSNLFPALFRDFYKAASSGDWGQADLYQTKVISISKALYSTGFTGTSYLRGLKCALELSGLCRAEFAPPLTKFTPSEYVALADAFHGVTQLH